MNGKKTVPINSWKDELTRLTAEKFSLCEDFYKLKDETRYMELLRKSTENLIRDNERDTIPTRKRSDLEL